MRRVRPPKRGSRYYLPPTEYKMVAAFCMNYGEFKRQLLDLDGKKAQIIDGMPHGTDTTDPTFSVAEKRVRLQEKINLIESTVRNVCPEIYEWVLLGITTTASYDYLLTKLDIPCSHPYFIKRVRKVYYEIAQKL